MNRGMTHVGRWSARRFLLIATVCKLLTVEFATASMNRGVRSQDVHGSGLPRHAQLQPADASGSSMRRRLLEAFEGDLQQLVDNRPGANSDFVGSVPLLQPITEFPDDDTPDLTILPPATDEEAEEVEAQFGDPGGEDITVEQVAEVADDDDDTETAASAVCPNGVREDASPIDILVDEDTGLYGHRYACVKPAHAVDWRKNKTKSGHIAVGPVRNQGLAFNCTKTTVGAGLNGTRDIHCGSCWAHAAMGAIESAVAIFRQQAVPSLSVQQAIDCYDLGSYITAEVASNTANKTCTGSWASRVFRGISNSTESGLNIVSEDDIPYSGTYGTWTLDDDENLEDNCPETTGGVTIDGWVTIDGGNEYAMMQAVSRQPIAVAINANKFHSYKGGWLNATNFDLDKRNKRISNVNHAVVVVGYTFTDFMTDNVTGQGIITMPGFWIVRNSWGNAWPHGFDPNSTDAGYAYVPMQFGTENGQYQQGPQHDGALFIAREATYPVITSYEAFKPSVSDPDSLPGPSAPKCCPNNCEASAVGNL